MLITQAKSGARSGTLADLWNADQGTVELVIKSSGLRNTTGFGLTVGRLPFDRSPNDFSWEWYKPETPGVFRKLQGGSRVRVEFFGLPSTSELRSVTFMDDAVFEYVEDLCCKPEDGGPTHILEITAGSVLFFPADGS